MKNDNTEDSRCQIIGKEEKQFIKVMFDQIMFWNTPNKFVKLPKCNLDPHLKLGKSFPWWELIFNVTRLTNSYWSQTIVQVVWTVAPILFSIILCNHPHYCNWEQNLTHWLDSVLIWTDFTCDLIYLSESTPDLQESDPLCPAVTDKAMTLWYLKQWLNGLTAVCSSLHREPQNIIFQNHEGNYLWNFFPALLLPGLWIF